MFHHFRINRKTPNKQSNNQYNKRFRIPRNDDPFNVQQKNDVKVVEATYLVSNKRYPLKSSKLDYFLSFFDYEIMNYLLNLMNERREKRNINKYNYFYQLSMSNNQNQNQFNINVNNEFEFDHYYYSNYNLGYYYYYYLH